MSISPFDKLPIEITNYIFNFLPPEGADLVRRVCQLFNNVIKENKYIQENIFWYRLKVLSESNNEPPIISTLTCLKFKFGKAKEACTEIHKSPSLDMRVIIKYLCTLSYFDQAQDLLMNSKYEKKDSLFESIIKFKAKRGLLNDNDVCLLQLQENAKIHALKSVEHIYILQKNFDQASRLINASPCLSEYKSHLFAARVRSLPKDVELLDEWIKKADEFSTQEERTIVFGSLMIASAKRGHFQLMIDFMLKVAALNRGGSLCEALKCAVLEGFPNEVERLLFYQSIKIYQEDEVIATFEPGEMFDLLKDQFQEHIVLEAMVIQYLKLNNRIKALDIAQKLKSHLSLSIALSYLFPTINDKETFSELIPFLDQQDVISKSYILKHLAKNAKDEGYDLIINEFSNFNDSKGLEYNHEILKNKGLALALKKENCKLSRSTIQKITDKEKRDAALLELLAYYLKQHNFDEAGTVAVCLTNRDIGSEIIAKAEIEAGMLDKVKHTIHLIADRNKRILAYMNYVEGHLTQYRLAIKA